MHGLHLTADLLGCRCDPRWLEDAQALLATCVDAVREAGLCVVNQLAHSFEPTVQGPGGVTATVLLAESHLCVHTWPELRGATLDVYVCNINGDRSDAAQALMGRLLALFDATRCERHALRRGLRVPSAMSTS